MKEYTITMGVKKMKKLCAIAIAIAAIMMISPLIGIVGSPEQDARENPVALSDANISISDYILKDNLTVSKVSSIEDINSASANTILEISSYPTVESSNSTQFFAALSSKIQQGIPVVSTNGSDLFIENDLNVSIAVSPEATLSAVYYDPISGNTACYSVICSDPSKAASLMSNWLEDITNTRLTSSANSISASSNSPIWGKETTSYTDVVHGDYGEVNVRTTYSEQVTESNTHRYFKAVYDLQSVPNPVDKRARTSDMVIWSDVDDLNANNVLRAYGPTTTSGTSSASVSLSWGVDASGVSVGMSTSWEYSVPDVTVADQSNYADDFFRTVHDVDESKGVGMNTYKIEPGTIVSTLKSSNNGAYRAYDNYEVVFCNTYEHLWPWDPYFHQYDSCSFRQYVNIS